MRKIALMAGMALVIAFMAGCSAQNTETGGEESKTQSVSAGESAEKKRG